MRSSFIPRNFGFFGVETIFPITLARNIVVPQSKPLLLRNDCVKVVVRTRDHVNAHHFTHRARGGRAGVDSSLDGRDVARDEDRAEPAADFLPAAKPAV